jgi:pimeloyl-ACP methyl ester carboxylesterase
MWEEHVRLFAEHFKVLTLDSRCHGKTDSSPEAFSYRTMADDVASFIQVLCLKIPYVCGFSDGGQVALELGMRYPDLAGRLIVGAAWAETSPPSSMRFIAYFTSVLYNDLQRDCLQIDSVLDVQPLTKYPT